MNTTRLTATVIVILATVLTAACSPSPETASTEPEITEESATGKMEKPSLSDSLIRNCQKGQGFSGIMTGELAVDFTLKDTRGLDYNLAALLLEKPVVMVFGSFT